MPDLLAEAFAAVGESSRSGSTSSRWTPPTAPTSPTARPSTCTPTPTRWRPRSGGLRAGRGRRLPAAAELADRPLPGRDRPVHRREPRLAGRAGRAGDLARLAALGGFGRLGPRVARYLPDERLQRIFSFQALYAGVAPNRALGAYAVIAYMDTIAGVYFPRGGMRQVGRALADAAVAAGAEIVYGRTVTGLEQSGGRVTRRPAPGHDRRRPRGPRTERLPVRRRRPHPGPAGRAPAGRPGAAPPRRRCATRRAPSSCTPALARTRPELGPPHHLLRRGLGVRPSARSSTTAG